MAGLLLAARVMSSGWNPAVYARQLTRQYCPWTGSQRSLGMNTSKIPVHILSQLRHHLVTMGQAVQPHGVLDHLIRDTFGRSLAI